ncbi:hypothetical protein K431DRAFT_292163 [Polychaeton citri CBS 116435]|uniref:Zn(2)-C6 fungal-type domain-containing protein n=1 Tax=Polychaeton citri CBS 116435 TaxID=1314669 RepID=A0A9P4QFQ3_9PEZI|nr:hypothetical protein K431DRAFT_292163 [Polychaeton citri CBS 116435]
MWHSSLDGANSTETSPPSNGNASAQPGSPGAREKARAGRSSVACVKCRDSKTRCENDGAGSVCKKCSALGRACIWKEPATTGSRKREGSLSGVRPEGFGSHVEKRVKTKRHGHPSHAGQNGHASHGHNAAVHELLDPQILTSQVWTELFAIFQTHYSADFSFVHERNFLLVIEQQRVGQHNGRKSSPSASTAALALQSLSNEFLLAFLALTARHHAGLIERHFPGKSKPLNAGSRVSVTYSRAAIDIVVDGTYNLLASEVARVQRVQAMLMLAYHDWGSYKGLSAWAKLGAAKNLAHAIGLGHEDRPADKHLLSTQNEKQGSQSTISGSEKGLTPSPSHTQTEQLNIWQEIKRRTFWSCFILDRYLSVGKNRPTNIQIKHLRIPLPASEDSFLHGEKVRTLMLTKEGSGMNWRPTDAEAAMSSPSDDESEDGYDSDSPLPVKPSETRTDRDSEALEAGDTEGLMSRYIKILQIYRQLAGWATAGGRRIEKRPPWDDKSRWQKYHRLCQQFQDTLPQRHRFHEGKATAHIRRGTSAPFIMIHCVYLLCQIILHREYLPFTAFACSRPVGPLSPPMLPEDRYPLPTPTWWEDSARSCFQASRDVMDLARFFKKHNAWVDTPVTSFVIYLAAFCGMYTHFFPHMDPAGTLRGPSPLQTQAWTDPLAGGTETLHLATEFLKESSPMWKQIIAWKKSLKDLEQLYTRKKREKQIRHDEGGSSSREDSQGDAGNLAMWERIEANLTAPADWGQQSDEDEGPSRPETACANGAVQNARWEPPSEDATSSHPAPLPRQTWMAVNHTPKTPVDETIQASAIRPFHNYPEPLANGNFRPDMTSAASPVPMPHDQGVVPGESTVYFHPPQIPPSSYYNMQNGPTMTIQAQQHQGYQAVATPTVTYPASDGSMMHATATPSYFYPYNPQQTDSMALYPNNMELNVFGNASDPHALPYNLNYQWATMQGDGYGNNGSMM